MIKFNIPPCVGGEIENIQEVISARKICGDGKYTKRCNQWLESWSGSSKVLLTTSCTHALEMGAILADIKQGDEVILPSYTFVSTADAFVARGARIKFVDIRPDTMNIDEMLIEQAVTSKTKAIIPVHYAGVGCEMDTIVDIANQNRLFVIEDAAQGVKASYKNQALGSIGDFGCYSFHETKNYSMGEGGAIAINNVEYVERAEVIREKGTNRSRFFRGEVDKYTWVEFGSSYLPSELNSAYLYAQLEEADKINSARKMIWDRYYRGLSDLAEDERISLPFVPDYCDINGHMFYIKTKDIEERSNLINYLKENDIYTVFHYVPLHSSVAGRKYGEFIGEDVYTTRESERLLRLPMYYGLENAKVDMVVEKIYEFYKKHV